MTRLLCTLMLLLGASGCADYDAILALEGDSTEGATVFSDHCASCHGADGTGGTGPDLTSHIGHHSSAQLVGVVVEGDGVMPGFAGTLDDQQIADVLAFLVESWGE